MAITEEQKQRRKGFLGASDVARIMCGYGVSVALDKLGAQNSFDELEDLYEIRIGHRVEPLILDSYEKRHGCELVRSPDTIMHPDNPWIGVHRDAIRSAQIDVEGKTCGAYNISEYGEPGSDKVPDYVLWQAHAGMSCTGAMRTDIAVCFINLEATRSIILNEPPPIFEYIVERDYVLEEALVKKSKMVWECIQRGVTPPPENLNDIKLIYSRHVPGSEIEASDEIFTTWEELAKLQDLNKQAGKKIDEYKFKIEAFMKEASELRGSSHQLLATWKNDSDGVRVDLDKLRDDYPDVYKECLVPRPGPRKFLIKKPKAKR